jgi:hypothetical protein
MGRHERAALRAGEQGDWAKVEHHTRLLDRAVAEYNRVAYGEAGPPPRPAADPPATRVGEYTWASTVDMTDDDLSEAYLARASEDDEPAMRAIERVWDQREALVRERDAEIAEHQAEQRRQAAAAWEAWQATPGGDDPSPLSNPAARPGRRRSADQRCREEYDGYLYSQYLAAEHACRGVLLNREGQAKRIDARSLFSGPNSCAARYASVELKQWWGRHGRMTYAEWRYAWHGRRSDRDAARTAVWGVRGMTNTSNSPPRPSEILTQKQILDAQNAGRVAFDSGEHITVCPHTYGQPGEDEEATQRREALRLMWVRSYAAAENDHRSPSRR